MPQAAANQEVMRPPVPTQRRSVPLLKGAPHMVGLPVDWVLYIVCLYDRLCAPPLFFELHGCNVWPHGLIHLFWQWCFCAIRISPSLKGILSPVVEAAFNPSNSGGWGGGGGLARKRNSQGVAHGGFPLPESVHARPSAAGNQPMPRRQITNPLSPPAINHHQWYPLAAAAVVSKREPKVAETAARGDAGPARHTALSHAASPAG